MVLRWVLESFEAMSRVIVESVGRNDRPRIITGITIWAIEMSNGVSNAISKS